MSTGLREALEKRLPGLPVLGYENGYPTQALPKAELLSLLAAHPADPATDERTVPEDCNHVCEHLYESECANQPRPCRTREELDAAIGAIDRPLLDGDAVRLRLQTAKGHRWNEEQTVNALLELARPMPSLDELAATIHRATCLTSPRRLCPGPNDADRHQAAAVLTLLNGDQS